MEKKIEKIKEKIKLITSKGENPLKSDDFMAFLSTLDLTVEENEEVFELINSKISEQKENDNSSNSVKVYSTHKNNPMLNLYIKDISKYEPLSEEETKQLFIDLRNGDESAREKIFKHNLKLVVHFVLGYRSIKESAIMDFIQEGNLGLLRAIELYDYTKGFRFSTYASYWIREKMMRYSYLYGQAIRTPIHQQMEAKRLKRVKETLMKELSRDPSEEEIINRMGITLEKLRKLEKSSLDIFSLDYNYNEDDEDEADILNVISSGESVEENVLNEFQKENLRHLIEKAGLTAREKLVIEMKYLSTDEVIKDATIAKHFHVQRERIRQVKNKALRKLKYQLQKEGCKEEI